MLLKTTKQNKHQRKDIMKTLPTAAIRNTTTVLLVLFALYPVSLRSGCFYVNRDWNHLHQSVSWFQVFVSGCCGRFAVEQFYSCCSVRITLIAIACEKTVSEWKDFPENFIICQKKLSESVTGKQKENSEISREIWWKIQWKSASKRKKREKSIKIKCFCPTC